MSGAWLALIVALKQLVQPTIPHFLPMSGAWLALIATLKQLLS